MYYVLTALLCAALGTLPLLIGKRFVSMAVQGSISFFVLWLIVYSATPSTVWPLFGLPGVLVVVLWIVSILVVAFTNDDYGDFPWVTVIPLVGALILYLGSVVVGSGFFRSDDYKAMIGSMENRVWTQDVQPKDPRHMRMATQASAAYLAKKAIGQDGPIGSQFQTEEGEFTLQMINGALWYVAPLEFSGFAVWNSVGTSPGYIMVSAEDPNLQPKFVKLSEGQQMRYLPSAFFGDNLERYLREHGYLDKGLTDFSFEIDEEQHAWWVVTVYHPTIVWDGEKVDGVAIVNPASGDIKFYPLGSVPSWVDRVVPDNFTKNYLSWRGEYVHGWGNSWWGNKDTTKPEDPLLVYGDGGEPEWVTGLSSNSGKNDALVGVVYTNSRTGVSRIYSVPGGATNDAILKGVNASKPVGYLKGVKGIDPQLYNIYGSMAAVVPLVNENNSFQGVAIVSVQDINRIAVGNDQYAALREYEKQLSATGVKTGLEKDRELDVVDGVVDRISADVTSSGSVYYFHLVGVPHLFDGGSSDSPKLPVTQRGDRVRIEYYNSTRDVIPVHSFNNLSLVLSESTDQKQVKESVVQGRASQEANEDAATVRDRINNLTPEQLQQLRKQVPASQPQKQK
jgi:uncharacterized membrane protein